MDSFSVSSERMVPGKVAVKGLLVSIQELVGQLAGIAPVG
jgi:hypothetical protein